MTPDEYKLYRIQRLIRMGEWLTRHRAMLVALYDAIDDAHTDSLETELVDTLLLETLQRKQSEPLQALGTVIRDLRGYDSWGAEPGKDVTLHNPNACEEHKYEVIIPAAKPETEETT